MEQSRIEKCLTADIQKLREEVFVQEQHVPVELEIEAGEDKYIHCCIYKEDELIAYARVSLSHPVGIGRVCVKKKYRGLGYGRKVMKLAEEQVTESTEIHLHAQIHAKGFYESLGYTPFGDLFLEAGIEHISMKKTIVLYNKKM